MTFNAHAAPPASTAEIGFGHPILGFATQTLAVVGAELQKLRHDPWELVTRAIQPVLWLLLFGEVMAQVRGLSSGNLRYLDFLAAGILAQSVLFVAIFYGISAIWERDLGVLHRYLVESGAAIGTRHRQGAVGKRPRPHSGGVRLFIGVRRWRRRERQSVEYPRRRRRDHLGVGFVLDAFPHHRLHRQDTRTLHGNRTSADYADFFCEQCDLSARPNAGLAARRIVR